MTEEKKWIKETNEILDEIMKYKNEHSGGEWCTA